ncbi:MAG: hypothetical protein JWM25_1459 [Thermoleophilia bacterium]|nr:hypothetical protein [Thermoleophilia bacterium]MCZ4496876.1 hypothetical protein [Thermoleophilia bacterium]
MCPPIDPIGPVGPEGRELRIERLTRLHRRERHEEESEEEARDRREEHVAHARTQMGLTAPLHGPQEEHDNGAYDDHGRLEGLDTSPPHPHIDVSA